MCGMKIPEASLHAEWLCWHIRRVLRRRGSSGESCKPDDDTLPDSITDTESDSESQDLDEAPAKSISAVVISDTSPQKDLQDAQSRDELPPFLVCLGLLVNIAVNMLLLRQLSSKKMLLY